MNRLVSMLAGIALLIPIGHVEASSDMEWRFTVYLDQSKIGYHHFRLGADSVGYRLLSEAQFNVKVLFINAYAYAHRSEERWRGGCLASIRARTDDNGEAFFVQGAERDGVLALSTQDGDKTLRGCVRTFAYWNPGLLDNSRLLNAQTGEYPDVDMELVGQEPVSLRGETVRAQRYRLRAAGAAPIDLWYSDDGRWLALESMTESGATLRYVLN